MILKALFRKNHDEERSYTLVDKFRLQLVIYSGEKKRKEEILENARVSI
jgi:hypothetical protein